MVKQEKNIAIVGAGLVGSLLSIYLTQRGYKVDVYDRRPDIRGAENYGGRSINLALSDRGWRALRDVGIDDKIREMSIPMFKRIMHDVNGVLTEQPYGLEGQAIYSVSRGGLNEILLDVCDTYPNSTLHFDKKCLNVDLDNNELQFLDEKSGENLSIQPDLIFGTDGAYSAIRYSMQKYGRFNYSQDYLEHGYKELTIPPKEDGKHRLEKEALHIWPRGNFMMIALPNLDGSFTCTLFLPFEGENSFGSISTKDDVIDFFQRNFPDSIQHMPELEDDYFDNPSPALMTVKCYPWNIADRVVILGDASHAIVPFYGQGMNSGFEDCAVLHRLIDEKDENWEEILPEFGHLRKPDADAISDLAKYNFIEMRDLSGQKRFQLQKRIEKLIQEEHSEDWKPLYTMVTFSPEIRYSEAMRVGWVQREIMHELLEREEIKSLWYGDREYDDAELDAHAEKIWKNNEVRNFISNSIEKNYHELQAEKMPL